MSENTVTPQTAAPAPETAPDQEATPVRPIVFNGRKVPFTVMANPRGKGAEKGAPLLFVKYLGNKPSFAEVVQFGSLIGAEALAQAVHTEILRPLFVEASKQARVTLPDGKVGIDDGKFAATAQKLLVEFSSSQSAKQIIESELATVIAKMGELTQRLLTAQIKGEKLDQAELNAANQLLLKKAELEAKLIKKPKAAAAPVSSPVAAPAAL